MLLNSKAVEYLLVGGYDVAYLMNATGRGFYRDR